MGYETVEFLGEEFNIPDTIKDFLHYDELLTPMRVRTINRLSQDIKKDTRLRFDDYLPNYLDSNAKVYENLMLESANVLMNELFSVGIYDVTVEELLENTTAISKIHDLKLRVLRNMIDEGHRYVELKNEGLERAYQSAASRITGSGVMIFTSSITNLMIYSAVEKGILMSQAKEADREYEEAVESISRSTTNALDKMVRETILNQYYPSVMDILMDFNTKITSVFLTELVQHNKFDFDSIKNYNMPKAEQMLNNIDKVPDKVDFLKQVFNICPFSLKLYEKCFEQGLLDKETFSTAEYFGFSENLLEKMEGYIKTNLSNTYQVEKIISMIAEQKNVEQKEIWKKFYAGTIYDIERAYEKLIQAIEDKKSLDNFIKKDLCSDIMVFTQKSEEEVRKMLLGRLYRIVKDTEYSVFVDKGLISADKIRKKDSNATDLSDINAEFISDLTTAIMKYIEEAKRRLQKYEESKAIMDKWVREREEELNLLNSEKEKLGFFAFSKKKELSTQIANKTQEIAEYTYNHESKELWNAFERMYR